MHADGLVGGDFLSEMNACLDTLEAETGDACWVLTGDGCAFSKGFDLEALDGEVVVDAIRLLGRLLAFPVPSAAAINGHAFGIGAMLALACDFQCMRIDRGYWCLPEVDLGMPLAPAMTALLRQKLEPRTAADVLLSGRRLGGAEAAALGVVDEACEVDDLLARATARVAPLAGKHRPTYAALKRGLHRDALAAHENR